MNRKSKSVLITIAVLASFLAACGAGKSKAAKFVAPEIDPPADLIPAYLPEGYELVQGFQLSGAVARPEDDGPAAQIMRTLRYNFKSPAGNDILGVLYRNGEHSLLVTKSFYPGGTLDQWRAAFEQSSPEPSGCECECDEGDKCVCDCCPDSPDRVNFDPFPDRFEEIREERTIHGTRVAVIKSGQRWITVFLRGEYLLAVESGMALEEGGVTLEENLKIVASLLEIQS